MGQSSNKCSCFNSKEDKETEKFDQAEKEGDNDSKIPQTKNNVPEQATLKNLKSYVTFKNMENSSSLGAEESSSGNNNILFDTNSKDSNHGRKKHTSVLVYQGDNSNNANISPTKSANKKLRREPSGIMLSMKASPGSTKLNPENISPAFFNQKSHTNLKNTNEKEKNKMILVYNHSTVLKIQKVFRAFYFRKKIYPKLKEELTQEFEKLIKSLYNQYLTPQLKKQESSIGIKHTENSYKSLYSAGYSIGVGSTFTGGIRLFTKLLILEFNNMPSFYVGEVNIENQLHGKGILTQKDGTKYNGTFERNIFTGVGRIIDSEGTLFEGYFSNGKLDGRGTKKMLNGFFYIGDFVFGIREGKGKEETKDHIYEGHFSNDKKNGKGKLIYKILNDSYEGDFTDNLITGTGLYKWTNGESYYGSFVNGKMHGKGLYKWPDGGQYEGEYVNNIKEGKGIFRWANGKIFEGEFKNGRPSGPGFLTTKKKRFAVTFKDGKLTGKVNEINRINSRVDESSDEESFQKEEEEEENDYANNCEEEEEESEDVVSLSGKKLKKSKQIKENRKKISEENNEEDSEEEDESFSIKRSGGYEINISDYEKKKKIEEVKVTNDDKGKKKKKPKNEILVSESDSYSRTNSNAIKNNKEKSNKGLLNGIQKNAHNKNKKKLKEQIEEEITSFSDEDYENDNKFKNLSKQRTKPLSSKSQNREKSKKNKK